MNIVLRARIVGLVIGLTLVVAGSVAASAPEPGITMPGMRIERVSLAQAAAAGQSVMATESAVAAARAHWEWPDGALVAINLVSFSDDQYVAVDQPEAGPVFENRLAWLISVTGIDFYGRGPGRSVNHEVHILVDASSGQVLELFSYK